VDDLWATKSEDIGLIDCAISFQDFQPMWSWSTNVTDRQTDGQTTCDSKTTLCTVSASCSKKYWIHLQHNVVIHFILPQNAVVSSTANHLILVYKHCAEMLGN